MRDARRWVARQDDNDWLLRHDAIVELRPIDLCAHEREIDAAPHERFGELGRIVARYRDLDPAQFALQENHGFGKPVHLLAREEAEREGLLDRSGRRLGRLYARVHLSQCQPRVFKEGDASRSQFDPSDAAGHQFDAHLTFQVPHLTTQRGLGRMEPLLGGDRQAPLFRDRDEIPEMPQLHDRSHA